MKKRIGPKRTWKLLRPSEGEDREGTEQEREANLTDMSVQDREKINTQLQYRLY